MYNKTNVMKTLDIIQFKHEGKSYEIKQETWLTYKNELATGFSCQITPSENISGRTLEEIKNKIINHNPFSTKGAESFYGIGIYNGD